jgi:protein involved in polysaccharide export with SLBB domain
MRIRIVAIAIALFVCHISLNAQNMPWMPVSKLGTLIPGDTLSIRFFRPPEDKLDGVINLTLTVAVAADGTITVPVLDKVPAAGLSIMELYSVLQQRYAAAFIHPPYGFTTSIPPRVTVGYLEHTGGTAMDKLIDRIGKQSTGR